MVRVGGLQYSIDPAASMGNRISEMHLNGQRIDADKNYKVAGWAPVSGESKEKGGEPIWDLVARHLKEIKTVKARRLNTPTIRGMKGNQGIEDI